MSWSEAATEVLRLPRPQRRLRRLADLLCEGHSVVWFLPEHAPVGGLITALEEHCRGRIVDLHSVHVSEEAVAWPEKWLMDHYGIPGDPWSEQAVDAILKSKEVPEVLVVHGLDCLSEEGMRHWIRFLGDWARMNRHPDRGLWERKALLVLLRGPRVSAWDDRMPNEPLLDKVWYWGWTTPQEVRVVASEYLRERCHSYASRLWGEAVWTSLAGVDVDFFVWMAETLDVRLPLADVLARLREYGERRGFGTLQHFLAAYEDAVDWWLDGTASDELQPPSAGQSLWLAGALDWHDDWGYGLHSALLSMAGRDAALWHRIWRGQAALLLPMIDQIRIAVSLELASTSRLWRQFLEQRKDVRGCLDGFSWELSAELNDVVEFLDGHGAGTAGLRELRRNVNAIRLTRNYLAHYRPVEWRQFEQVCVQYPKYARTDLTTLRA